MSRCAKTSSLSRLAKHGSHWVGRLPKSYRDAIAQASLVDSVGATASGLLAWRDALLEGKTPTVGRWPAGVLGQQLAEWCEQSGVLPHCRDNPELVDLVVLAMLQLILHVGPGNAYARNQGPAQPPPERKSKPSGSGLVASSRRKTASGCESAWTRPGRSVSGPGIPSKKSSVSWVGNSASAGISPRASCITSAGST